MKIIKEGPYAHIEVLMAWSSNISATILSESNIERKRFDSQLNSYKGPPAFITWTSGTGGPPKGVAIPWDIYDSRCKSEFDLFGGKEPLETSISTLSQGTWRIMPMKMGCNVVYADNIKDIAQAILANNITCLFAHPRHLDKILDYIKEPIILKKVVTAGEPLNDELRIRAENTFKTKVLNCYGTTEAGIIATSYSDEFTPIKDVEVKIIDNKIAIKSPYLANSYIDSPLSERDGWHLTKDEGEMVGDKFLIKGRFKRNLDD